MMPISIRLEKELEHALRARVANDDIAVSEFIRAAIREKLVREENAANPYELGKDVFGKYAGQADLSTNRKALIRERLSARYRRR